jgi:murein L,D-transpeptidase YafK
MQLARSEATGKTGRPLARRTLLAGLGALPLLGAPAIVRAAPPVDLVAVYKGLRTMHLMHKEQPVRTYRVAIGRRPHGHKQQQGDGRTPEGLYLLDGRNPNSAFHLSIRISYPNAKDSANAWARGVPPGNNIMIHGLPNGFTADQIGHPEYDWTDGCVAVTNAEMGEIWDLVRDGTPIVLLP